MLDGDYYLINLVLFVGYNIFMKKTARHRIHPIISHHIPTISFYLYFAWQAKDFLYLQYLNPTYVLWSLVWMKKSLLIEKINSNFLPKTLCINIHKWLDEQYERWNFWSKIIAKPDRWVRWSWVRFITEYQELLLYYNEQKHNKENFLVQEYIDYPYELWVFYIQGTNEKKWWIVSISMKQPKFLLWDGKRTIQELLYERWLEGNINTLDFIAKIWYKISDILEEWKTLYTSVLFNHAQWAECKDISSLIKNSDILQDIFSHIAKSLGLGYWRFDVKVKSLDNFTLGKDFKILESNLLTSEPLHIYDDKYSLLQALRIWFWYWERMYDICMYHKKQKDIKKRIWWKEFFRLLRENYKYM